MGTGITGTLRLGRISIQTARFQAAQTLTANSFQVPGTPLSSCSPRSLNAMPDPATRSATVRDTRTSPGDAEAETRWPMCTAIPPMSSPIDSISPV